MQTVGEILRAERVKKGLSIKDVESAISIRALYLNAIEEGNYSIIPGEVYLKGFIRNYATFLGLNSQQVMEIYRQSKGQVQENSPAVNQQEEPTAKQQGKSGSRLATWLTIAAIAAGVVVAAVWWSSGSQKPAPTPPPSTAQQQPVPANPQPVLPTAPQPQPAVPAKPASKVIVTAKYSAPCWTSITADGKQIYEGIPKGGESLTWEAASTLSAKFGNAGAVDLVYNGSPVGKIGENGQVVLKMFTLTGITQ
ncbi:Cytoskeleton protein RodZ [Sporomusa carbonis]|uniref:helix-turn-helix domain-containing protein n=1 Tax=Sporomusa carbonis TaxID=3076075 RepID=UPI003A621EC2